MTFMFSYMPGLRGASAMRNERHDHPAAGRRAAPQPARLGQGRHTCRHPDSGSRCTPEEVELFLVAPAAHIDVEPPGGRDEMVDALLREDLLSVAGRLRLDDTDTGVSVLPGCCAGLEDWREWTSIVHGGTPWLRHVPGPEVEARGDLLRVWQRGGPARRGPYVDLTRAGPGRPGRFPRPARWPWGGPRGGGGSRRPDHRFAAGGGPTPFNLT